MRGARGTQRRRNVEAADEALESSIQACVRSLG